MITDIGLFILPFILFFLLFKNRYIFYSLIFSLPFTSTAFYITSNGSAITITNFLTYIFLFKIFYIFLLKKKLNIPGYKNFFRFYFFLFIHILIVFCSVFMPFYIDGDLKIFSGNISNIDFDTPVFFTVSNLFKLQPFISGYLLFFIIIIYINNSINLLISSVKIYSISILFCSFWGLYQFFTIKYGLNYVTLFNNFSEKNQMILGTILEGNSFDLIRIASTTQEPSHFSQILLTIFPLFLLSIIFKIKIFNILIDQFYLIIILLLVFLSTSTAALIGLIVIIITINFYTKNFVFSSYKFSKKLLFIFLLFASLIIYIFFPDFFNQLIFDKASSGSALERLYSIQTAWSYFVQYPILGIGWGVVTSHDLFVLFLSNSGILGLLTFLAFNIYLIKSSIKLTLVSREITNNIQFINIGFAISLINLLIISIFVEFTWYLSHYYFIISIIILTNNILKNRNLNNVNRPFNLYTDFQ